MRQDDPRKAKRICVRCGLPSGEFATCVRCRARRRYDHWKRKFFEGMKGDVHHAWYSTHDTPRGGGESDVDRPDLQ